MSESACTSCGCICDDEFIVSRDGKCFDCWSEGFAPLDMAARLPPSDYQKRALARLAADVAYNCYLLRVQWLDPLPLSRGEWDALRRAAAAGVPIPG